MRLLASQKPLSIKICTLKHTLKISQQLNVKEYIVMGGVGEKRRECYSSATIMNLRFQVGMYLCILLTKASVNLKFFLSFLNVPTIFLKTSLLFINKDSWFSQLFFLSYDSILWYLTFPHDFSSYLLCDINIVDKWRKDSDIYLTTACRHHWSRQMTMKVDKLLELSASTVTFISWRGRLTKVLAGAARGEQEVRVGEAEWGYWMLMPGNWRDSKTSWSGINIR